MEIEVYLAECRAIVIDEIRHLVPKGSQGMRPVLYDLMLDYPLREAKALRPALCIACCRALGGRLDAVLSSAAVIELYHNAFLIHDDIEDGSSTRRGFQTLHLSHGVPVAINVGDAMLALSLRPLLDNTRTMGLGRALRVLEVVSTMSELSVEGQALELDWIRNRRWDLSDEDYLVMAERKTAWYSFVAPLQIGGIAAGAASEALDLLTRLGRMLGLAFQIQDDALNLEPDRIAYGKEANGDLWEGKRTLVLLHMLRSASSEERERSRAILEKPRPPVGAQIDGAKNDHDVAYLRDLINEYGSIEHARRVAHDLSRQAQDLASGLTEWMKPSPHRDFLDGIIEYVHTRAH
jgi:geranylgeranyl diphosphate synthase type II